ncbi:MAG: MFS transporter, partial [Oscillospiraceae bacterium]|nr:MFS transporter [Oscillospiraceae bacterium]
MNKAKLSGRTWLSLVLIGLVGQFAWTIENMYFNVFLYQTISTDPRYIADMVAWSAASATLTTLLMGALSDRIGKRKALVVGGYLLWGLATAAFGLVTVENAGKLFGAADAVAAAATLVIVLDCLMTFFGSTANDAAFNAWVTDVTEESNRGRAESVLAILPLISMLVIFGLFDGMTQRGEWQKFFFTFGGLVTAVGILSIFIMKEPPLTPRK